MKVRPEDGDIGAHLLGGERRSPRTSTRSLRAGLRNKSRRGQGDGDRSENLGNRGEAAPGP